MTFTSLENAELFKYKNLKFLSALCVEVEEIESVAYSDVWLNGKAPSFVAGYDDEDTMIVCLPIKKHQALEFQLKEV